MNIEYVPILPKRREATRAIADAIRALSLAPTQAGKLGSFVLEKRQRGAAHTASRDAGIPIRTRIEGDKVRVWIPAAPVAPATTEQPPIVAP